MRRSVLHIVNVISFILAVFALSCSKENVKDIEATRKSETVIAAKFNPVEINFSSQVVKNIQPTVTKAKAPQLVFEDKNLVQSQGVKITVKKDSVRTFILKELPTRIVKPIVVKAKHPVVTVALPYKTKENNPNNFKYLDVEQGLKNATIFGMVEDKDGAIWFASRVGLTKYDGQKFYHYSDNQGLVFNHVFSLTIDHLNNLWIGTYGGGLSKFDGKTFSNYTLDSGLPSNTINTIFEDSKHTIWIGTEGGGACSLRDSIMTFYNGENAFPPNIKAFEEDGSGDIILGSLDNGVFFIRDNIVKVFSKNCGLIDNSIKTILVDRKKNVWFGGDKNGLSKFNGDTFLNFSTDNGLSDNVVTDLVEDISGNIWVSTYHGGISKYDGISFHNYTTDQGLNSNVIQSLCSSEKGVLWIGTEGTGMAKFSGDVFTHKTTNEGLTNNWIWSITQTKNKNFWFSTNGDGVNLFTSKQFNAFTDKEGLNNNVIISQLVNDDGSIWFGGYENGACFFNQNEFKTINSKHGLLDNTIWTIAKDANKNVWFGTENGLSKYDGATITNYFDSLNAITVYSSLLDKEKTLWFGTNGYGLLQFKNNQFYKITKEQGLVDDVISCILQDASGNLWFGSQNGGVSRLKDGVFTNLSESNGLSNSAVLSMVLDEEGNIWFGTRAGINKLPQSKINLSKQELESSSNLFSTYGINEGFTGNNCIRNSVFMDHEHKIWWGTTKMLTTYNPGADHKDTVAPKVLINNIKLFFEEVDWNKFMPNEIKDSINVKHKGIKLTGISAWNNLPIDLVLPYHQNHITFDFTGINFRSQEKIKYQYILEGSDEDWNPITSETKAVFGNLPHGKFTFKIKAVNKDGVWSEPITYAFEISPPWWKTWWARTLGIVSSILFVYFFVKYRERTLKLRQVELENTVEDRTKEVVSQKEIVEKKQTEILDSINYAKRIQHSLLASNKLLDAYLKENSEEKNTASDYFIVFKPKDIVSGDFYWASKLSDDNFVILTADSTGHGVPGAIMSILNIACLKEAISKGNTRPDLLLNETRRLVIENLNNDGSAEGGKDGMDGSLLSFDFKNHTMYCASANNPIWIIRDGALIEIKADRMPIGKHDKDKTPFTMNTFSIQKGDLVYTLTDGFPDQFGGADGKKFKSKQLQSFLLSIAHEPMAIQQQKLNHAFDTWRGDLDQVDDVCLIGVKI
jgi:ligand-binding sensor domain-containing protein/serine phosphatase RsbU (regulator of sigma subunit)